MINELTIGTRVQIIKLPAYIKTADPMPMLRPPTVLQIGEVGTIFDRRPGNYWAIKFDRGSYLIEPEYIEAV
jgi:hypothetical protein